MRETFIRPKIAHFGAFDHDSYGDLIFPLLVEHFLPEFEFIHVSPSGNLTPWSDAKPTISINEAFARKDWDGVLIGGGDIVQSGEWVTDSWAQTPLLAMGALPSLWCGASLLAAKLNIPCVWNCPGVPRSLPYEIESIAIEALKSVDYLCLRDRTSADRLNKLMPRPASIAPDSALGICELWPAKRSTDKVKSKPLVLSLTPVDAHLRWHEIEALIDIISAKYDFSGEVIVIPLMGWQIDSGLISLPFKLKSGLNLTVRDRSLSLQECALEIENASVYVGNSLHGLITAISYGVPAVLVKPLEGATITKYDGFAEHFSLNGVRLVVESFTEAAQVLMTYQNIIIKDASDRLHEHWSNVRDCLQSKSKIDKSYIWQNVCESMRQENETMLLYGISAQQLLTRVLKLKQQIVDLETRTNALNQAATERDAQIVNLIQSVTERDAQIDSLSQTQKRFISSLSWQFTKPLRFISRVLRGKF